jgi:hypothetical protein
MEMRTAGLCLTGAISALRVRTGTGVKRVLKPDGTLEGKAYAEIRDLPPSEVLVLSNHP